MRELKYLLSGILLLVFFQVKLFSQTNLLKNPSFEDPVSSTYPFNYAQFEYVDHWDQDETTHGYFYAHSPDWFMFGYNRYYMKNFVINNGQGQNELISGHSGNGYIGMYSAELIEQNLSNHLTNGAKYTLTAWVRPVTNPSMGEPTYFPPNLWDGAILTVHLSTKKIHYRGVLKIDFL